MWNSTVCDVLPTISEDAVSQRSSQCSNDNGDNNVETIMVSLLEERDKLMDSLRDVHERLSETEMKAVEAEHERDVLQKQLSASLPQVFEILIFYFLLKIIKLCKNYNEMGLIKQ